MPPTEFPVAALKAELFKALAHPARIRVLEILVSHPRSVGELADDVGLEISHLSQQLGVLRRAGVVDTRREGNTVYYSLRDPRMAALLTLARRILATNLENSQELLTGLQVAGDLRHPNAAPVPDAEPEPEAEPAADAVPEPNDVPQSKSL